MLVAVVIPSGALCGIGQAAGADGYKKAYAAKAANTQSAAQGSGTIYLADGTHIHPNALGDDGHDAQPQRPGTKNAISRTAPATDDETADPTTPAQARRRRRRRLGAARGDRARRSRTCR